MRRIFSAAFIAAVISAFAACSSQNGVVPGGVLPQASVAQSCEVAAPGDAQCFALFRTDVGGGNPTGYHGTYSNGRSAQSTNSSSGSPSGYSPSDLQNAYALPSASGGAGQTVAIVDAYDDPNAES